MDLKPELLQTMTSLGVTPEELELLKSRMLSAVTSLQAGITSLDAQIVTLQGQRNELLEELNTASVTVAKLIETPPAEPQA